MARFVDTRATDYEQHMRESVEDVAAFYRSIADALPEFENSPNILDSGIGTGLEMDHLSDRFPRASVTGIDVSEGMLDELARKRRPWSPHLKLLTGSFLELDLGHATYDAVISSMALHHWVPQVKLGLYSRIHRALRVGGFFVNGDFIESEKDADRRLAEFALSGAGERHQQRIDLPLSPKLEQAILEKAGFGNIRRTFERTSVCVFVASKLRTQAFACILSETAPGHALLLPRLRCVLRDA